MPVFNVLNRVSSLAKTEAVRITLAGEGRSQEDDALPGSVVLKLLLG